MQSAIEQLREQQITGAEDVLTSLRTIEINPIEICNRSCSFCPRSDPTLNTNQKFKINFETTKKIANDLKEINYTGRIGFVGFGEPLIHKNLSECIRIVRDTVTTAQWIEVNTNGDFLTAELIKELADAGCTHLTVSMYDGDISNRLFEIKGNTDITVTPRHCYSEYFELRLVDRNELITESKSLNIKRSCFIPFYKLFIDWNGDILVCGMDWGRKSNIGNIMKESIKDIWLGETFASYRKELIKGNRKNCIPCNHCDVNGTLQGKDSFEIWKKKYGD